LDAFKKGFKDKSNMLQGRLDEAMISQMLSMRFALDLVRDDIVILESEKEPDFKRRVEEGLETAKGNLQRVLGSLSCEL
jgi:hypothetical protein